MRPLFKLYHSLRFFFSHDLIKNITNKLLTIESWDFKHTIFPTYQLPIKKIKFVEQKERILGQSLNNWLSAHHFTFTIAVTAWSCNWLPLLKNICYLSIQPSEPQNHINRIPMTSRHRNHHGRQGTQILKIHSIANARCKVSENFRVYSLPPPERAHQKLLLSLNAKCPNHNIIA